MPEHPSGVFVSDGPDQFRSHIKCKDFHTAEPPARDGHPDYCCCCNPCLYVRPGADNLDSAQFNHCCRCVPRVLFMTFTPSSADDCCKILTTPIFPELVLADDGTDRAWHEFNASMNGKAISIKVGPLGEVYNECVWKLTVTGYGIDLDEDYEIDHVDNTCFELPNITIENFEGIDGCLGTISFSPWESVKIPFIKRDLDEEYEDEQFIDIDPPCGDCTQICNVICVKGTRKGSQTDANRVEFVYDEELTYANGKHTWLYESRQGPEYIYLEENYYGQCEMSFHFKGGDLEDEDYDSIVIENCACQMDVSHTAQIGPSSSIAISIHCGTCGCWRHICETCRCAPEKICVVGLANGTAISGVILTWDPDNFEWSGVDSYGRGIVVGLGRDHYGACIVSGTYDGESIFGDPVFLNECGELFTFEMHGEPQDASNNFGVLIGSALAPDCDLGTCSGATPCVAECGSHPSSVTVSLLGDNRVGEPGFEDEMCEAEVTLSYYEVWAPTGGIPESDCGYIGWIEYEDCVVKVELNNGVLSMGDAEVDGYGPAPGAGGTDNYTLQSESCNPYSASYYEEDLELISCPWECSPSDTTTIQVIEIEITE